MMRKYRSGLCHAEIPAHPFNITCQLAAGHNGTHERAAGPFTSLHRFWTDEQSEALHEKIRVAVEYAAQKAREQVLTELSAPPASVPSRNRRRRNRSR